jgi:hypothetical protein
MPIIRVIADDRGAEIVFPAGRNLGAAAVLVGTLVLWGSMVGIMILFDFGPFFLSVFGGFWLLILAITLRFLLVVTRVRADRSGLRVGSGYLVVMQERTIPAAEITGVSIRMGIEIAGHAYSNIIVSRTTGWPVTIGRWVRDLGEAASLAATVRSALGL